MAQVEPNLLTHLLNRVTTTPTAAEVAYAEAIGYEGFLYEQLTADPSRTAAFEQELNTLLPTLGLAAKDLVRQSPEQVILELQVAVILRSLFSPNQLYEIMVEFWTNHFNISTLDLPEALLKTVDDREVIRPYALGRFRDLLHASAKSPAMLFYLDNAFSTKEAPNENYARELLELHTLGIDGGYTENDVQEVARCFTGWSVLLEPDITFGFYSFLHDYGEKTVLGHKIAAGGGESDGTTVLDLLASHPSTARHIAHKLAVHFVSDDPPGSLVAELATVFRDTDGDIRSLLWHLFTSREFMQARMSKLKRPFTLAVGFVRRLEVELDLNILLGLYFKLAQMGQLPFFWPPPDGYPDTAPHWITTNGLLARWNMAFELGFLLGDNFPTPAFTAPYTPERLVDQAAAYYLPIPISDTTRSALVATLTPYAFDRGALPQTLVPIAGSFVGMLLFSSPEFESC